MRTGFGISALSAGIAAEGVIAPSGIAVAFQLLTASVAGCIVAVHVTVFVGIYRFGSAVLAITASCTFTVGIECVIQPAGVSISFRDGSALRTLGFIAVHVGVFHRIYLGIGMGARR